MQGFVINTNLKVLPESKSLPIQEARVIHVGVMRFFFYFA